jgi:hypothetical protein
VREFLSKSIAGGLSAGVVLLWWPVLFAEIDTVTSWFVRGVAWTLCFELLLVALVPFERALWETARGKRISRTMGNAGSRLHSGSHRRRMGRLSAVATVALTVPVALLVAGLHEQAPAHAEAKAVAPITKPVAPIKVVRVTKVVRPVTVTRIIERAPVSGQPVVATPAPQQAAPPPAPPRTTEEPVPPTDGPVIGRGAPVQRGSAPKAQPEAAPQSVQGCEGDACEGSAPPAIREAAGSARGVALLSLDSAS